MLELKCECDLPASAPKSGGGARISSAQVSLSEGEHGRTGLGLSLALLDLDAERPDELLGLVVHLGSAVVASQHDLRASAMRVDGLRT